jgi:hypothetical protein
VQRLKLTYDVNTYQHYTSLLSPGLRSKVGSYPLPRFAPR